MATFGKYVFFLVSLVYIWALVRLSNLAGFLPQQQYMPDLSGPGRPQVPPAPDVSHIALSLVLVYGQALLFAVGGYFLFKKQYYWVATIGTLALLFYTLYVTDLFNVIY